MDILECLESNLITAQEGFLFSDVSKINFDKLRERKPLIVITTDEKSALGSINLSDICKKYGFIKTVILKEYNLIRYVIDSTDYNKLANDTKLNNYIKEALVNATDEMKGPSKKFEQISKIYSVIMPAIIKYMKDTKYLVILISENTYTFASVGDREYATIIIKSSKLKAVASAAIDSGKQEIKTQTYLNNRFNAAFGEKIPKELFINTSTFKLPLFHVSPNADLEELEPRTSPKRMEYENIQIARISATSNIDACFRAVGISAATTRKETYYVYKLVITPNTRIVKPSKKLVPDAEVTSEYWIMDKTKVEKVGSVEVSIDSKTRTLTFDDTNLPKDIKLIGKRIQYS